MKNLQRDMILVLVDIRSAHNVGSMFRTADAAGVRELCLVGYTPAPQDRFGRERKDIAKAALGAEKNIPWRQFATFRECRAYLKRQKYFIIALEQDRNAVLYTKVRVHKKNALIVGNETEGLSSSVCHGADMIVEIPMRGKKESLNVSVAAGIVLFEMILHSASR